MQSPEKVFEYEKVLIIPLDSNQKEKPSQNSENTSAQALSENDPKNPKSEKTTFQTTRTQEPMLDSKTKAEVAPARTALQRQLTGAKPSLKKPTASELKKKFEEFRTKVEDIEKLNNLKGSYKTFFFYTMTEAQEFIWEYRIDPINAKLNKLETRFTAREAKQLVLRLRANDYSENAVCYRIVYSQDKTRARVLILLSLLKNNTCYKFNSGVLQFMKHANATRRGQSSNPLLVSVSESQTLEKPLKLNEPDDPDKSKKPKITP